MKSLLLLIACVGFMDCFAQLQPAQLQLKKNGRVKKRFFAGTAILVQTSRNEQVGGTITGMKDSMVYINNTAVPVNAIRKFRLVYPQPPKKIDWKLLGYATLGVVVSTIGMTLSKWEKFSSAIITSAVIGYSPFVIKAGAKKLKKGFKKNHYKIGGRFSLRVWDIN